MTPAQAQAQARQHGREWALSMTRVRQTGPAETLLAYAGRMAAQMGHTSHDDWAVLWSAYLAECERLEAE